MEAVALAAKAEKAVANLAKRALQRVVNIRSSASHLFCKLLIVFAIHKSLNTQHSHSLISLT